MWLCVLISLRIVCLCGLEREREISNEEQELTVVVVVVVVVMKWGEGKKVWRVGDKVIE